jgi:hypothetical protein
MVNTGGGLFRDTEAALEHLWVLVMNESGEISTIVKNEVEGFAVLEGGELLFETPVVLLLGLAFPGKSMMLLG